MYMIWFDWIYWHINLCRLLNGKSSLYIYIHHHHIVLAARISLTLFRHSSLSFIALGRSSGQQPVSSHSCWMYVRAGRPAFARPCVGIHKSTSLMSSSLLLQQCPACLVRLWHINHCRLFNAKFSLYIYIKNIWFGLVCYHDISTIVRINFYLLRTFSPHLGSFFCVVSPFTTFRPNFTSGLLQMILQWPRIGIMCLVAVFPVITAFHSCCLSHHVFDQVNLWPAWVGFETAIFWQCSPGTVETHRLYLLCHGFQVQMNSYSSKMIQFKTIISTIVSYLMLNLHYI